MPKPRLTQWRKEPKKPPSFQDLSTKLEKQRRRRPVIRRLMIVMFVISVMGVMVLLAWFWQSGRFTVWVQAGNDLLVEWSSKAGINLQHVTLRGLKYLPSAEVLAVVRGHAEGMQGKDGAVPLYALPLPDIRDALEVLGWVKHVEIERKLPGLLEVQVEERVPYALWQHDGKVQLIDIDGEIIHPNVDKDWLSRPEHTGLGQLLLIVGSEANFQLPALLEVFAQAPELLDKVVSAVHVGVRRWDVYLRGDVVVKLPEQAPEQAWKELARLHHEQQLLDRAIKSIDLRLPDRLFIEEEGKERR